MPLPQIHYCLTLSVVKYMPSVLSMINDVALSILESAMSPIQVENVISPCRFLESTPPVVAVDSMMERTLGCCCFYSLRIDKHLPNRLDFS